MAFDTRTDSAFLTLDANYEFFTDGTDAIVMQLTPGESGKLVVHVDDVGTTDDVTVQVLQGHRLATGFGLDGATAADDLELNTSSDAISTDDDLNGTYIIMTSGDEQGEGRLITDSVAADDGVNLNHALSGTPSASETYDRYAFSVVSEFTIDVTSAAPGDDTPHNSGVPFSAFNGEFVAFRAKSGSTDSHRARAIINLDGISV